jgi:hypothetical protein
VPGRAGPATPTWVHGLGPLDPSVSMASFMFMWPQRRDGGFTCFDGVASTPSVSFYLSLDSVILHYPATNKKKRRED